MHVTKHIRKKYYAERGRERYPVEQRRRERKEEERKEAEAKTPCSLDQLS
jgi:hypothetical protein